MARLPTPALDAWQRRGRTDLHDTLWRAAVWERTALEAHAAGQRDRVEQALEAAFATINGRVCRSCARHLEVEAFRDYWADGCRACEVARELKQATHRGAQPAAGDRLRARQAAAERYVRGLVWKVAA